MGFCDDIERLTLPLMQGILSHPFVTGIGDGTLDVARFKHYISQDYAYLIDYGRALALCSARADDLETMSWFAKLLDETLNVEMDLHRGYCAEFGITAEELAATVAAPTTVAYTSFLLKVAYQGSFAELVAALLPCQWGYWEIGKYLAERGLPANAPLYAKWIEMYSNPEFAQLAGETRDLADRLGERAGPAELAAMGDAYVTCLRLERKFWDMGYNLEGWEE